MIDVWLLTTLIHPKEKKCEGSNSKQTMLWQFYRKLGMLTEEIMIDPLHTIILWSNKNALSATGFLFLEQQSVCAKTYHYAIKRKQSSASDQSCGISRWYLCQGQYGFYCKGDGICHHSKIPQFVLWHHFLAHENHILQVKHIVKTLAAR